MKLKIAVLLCFLCFLKLLTAGTLTENKKNGEYPHIEWYSAQIGGGFPFTVFKGCESNDEFCYPMNFVAIDSSLFTIKWKYAYFTPAEITFKVFMVGVGFSVRGGLRIPLNKSNEFRLGVKAGGSFLMWGGPFAEIAPHFAILHYKRIGAGHFGGGIDFPILIGEGGVHPGIFFYLKFGY